MLHLTRFGFAACLVLGAACQPRPRTETGMTGRGSDAVPAGLTDQDRASIRAVDEAWGKAAEAGNGQAIAALYAPDAVLFPPNEPMVKGDAAKKYWVDFAGAYSGPTELNTMTVEGSGDLATATGTYKMSLTPKKAGAKPLPTEEGKYVEVLKRQDDGTWRIVYDIWNLNAPPPKK
jgi:uncharacterized protein (TIGR02246 family)